MRHSTKDPRPYSVRFCRVVVVLSSVLLDLGNFGCCINVYTVHPVLGRGVGEAKLQTLREILKQITQIGMLFVAVKSSIQNAS